MRYQLALFIALALVNQVFSADCSTELLNNPSLAGLGGSFTFSDGTTYICDFATSGGGWTKIASYSNNQFSGLDPSAGFPNFAKLVQGASSIAFSYTSKTSVIDDFITRYEGSFRILFPNSSAYKFGNLSSSPASPRLCSSGFQQAIYMCIHGQCDYSRTYYVYTGTNYGLETNYGRCIGVFGIDQVNSTTSCDWFIDSQPFSAFYICPNTSGISSFTKFTNGTIFNPKISAIWVKTDPPKDCYRALLSDPSKSGTSYGTVLSHSRTTWCDNTIDGGGFTLVAHVTNGTIFSTWEAKSPLWNPVHVRTTSENMRAASLFREAKSIIFAWSNLTYANKSLNSYDNILEIYVNSNENRTMELNSRAGTLCSNPLFTRINNAVCRKGNCLFSNSDILYTGTYSFDVGYGYCYGIVSVPSTTGQCDYYFDSQINYGGISMCLNTTPSPFFTPGIKKGTTSFVPRTISVWVRSVSSFGTTTGI